MASYSPKVLNFGDSHTQLPFWCIISYDAKFHLDLYYGSPCMAKPVEIVRFRPHFELWRHLYLPPFLPPPGGMWSSCPAIFGMVTEEVITICAALKLTWIKCIAIAGGAENLGQTWNCPHP